MLRKGAIELVPKRLRGSGVYSRYFLVKKKTGGWRPILDLRRLNKFIKAQKFRMVTLQHVLGQLEEGDFLSSLDLGDAYFHIPILKGHRKFLRFVVQGRHYQFKALPFGLRSAPRVFTKCLAPVAAQLRREGIHVYPYLDDWLIRAKTRELAVAHTARTVQLLTDLGFSVNYAKSHLVPAQDALFLGARLNTVSLLASPSEERTRTILGKVQRMLVADAAKVRSIKSLLGMMSSCIYLVPMCRLRMRPLQEFLDALDPDDGQLRGEDQARRELPTSDTVVGHPRASDGGHGLPDPSPPRDSDHGCLPGRVGSAHRKSARKRTLAPDGEVPAHQRPGAPCSVLGPQVLPSVPQGQGGEDLHGQHHHHVLHQETGRNQVPSAVQGGVGPVALGHRPRDISGAVSSGRDKKHHRRLTQQGAALVPRVGTMAGSSGSPLPTVGHTPDRPVRDGDEHQVPEVRQQVSPGEEHGRCFLVPLGGPVPLRVPSPASANPAHQPAQEVTVQDDPRRTYVAEADLVPGPSGLVSVPANQAAGGRGSTLQGRRRHPPPRPQVAELAGLAPAALEFGGYDIPADCREVLAKARASSTLKCYGHKWKRFSVWCRAQKINPLRITAPQVLPYLLTLAKAGLAHASIKIHLAAISRYTRTTGRTSLWSHRLVKEFMKGLFRSFPPVKAPAPAWELNVVLTKLMGPPFEPLHSAPLKFLSWKTAFLVAITSARRVGEIQALSCKAPYLTFHATRVVLRTHPSFMPKVPSDFHLNEPLVLPVFFPSPSSPAERTLHSLDVARALKFYVDRTKCFRKTSQLFVNFGPVNQGKALSKASISRWLSGCIMYCHRLANRPLPGRPRAHSTRAIAATTAFLSGVPLLDICRAATWRSTHTFTKFYCVDRDSREESRVGQAVLRNLFA